MVSNKLNQQEYFQVRCRRFRDLVRSSGGRWPTEGSSLPFINVVEAGHTSSLKQFFDMTKHIDTSLGCLFMAANILPANIKNKIGTTTGAVWYFAPVNPSFSVISPNPNFRLLLTPLLDASGLSFIEVGCPHLSSKYTKSNCYFEFLCTQCGYHFARDTSD